MIEEIIAGGPEIGEASGQIEDNKAKPKGPSSWDGVPETIQDLLSEQPMLPHENEESFFALFESFRDYAKPENIIDFHPLRKGAPTGWNRKCASVLSASRSRNRAYCREAVENFGRLCPAI